MEKVLISVKEFAEKTSTSVVSVRRWIKAKKIKAVKMGKKVLIPVAEIYRIEKGG
jgi:excisionase family DNA binding protein